MARNLIVLIDGTMVSASRTDAYKSYSNVFELACLLQLKDKSEDGTPQVVFYTSGISSQPDTLSIKNLITGYSIKSQIVDQYTNICANFNFNPGEKEKQDKIYLFGFSRGAMAVRALAGLIAEFGLLHPKHIRHLPRLLSAWDRTEGRGSLPDHIELRQVDIEFVGVFDSVMGGVEWIRLFNPIRFSNQRMPGRINKAVQILAIDENRGHFKPKPWQSADEGIGADGKPKQPFLRQIWMPGVHSDIGGTGDPMWGRMALLAMTYFIDRETELGLDKQWIKNKEDILRCSFRGPFRIRRHNRLFNWHVRRPNKEACAQESPHPLCERIPPVNYDGRKGYDWVEKVFHRRFGDADVDPDLAAYFCRILRPWENEPSNDRPDAVTKSQVPKHDPPPDSPPDCSKGGAGQPAVVAAK